MSEVTLAKKQTAWILIVSGLIGLFASFELLVEKINLLTNPNYSLNCDINPVLSCGSVITTDQASAFGFPNPIMGISGFTVVVMFGALLLSKIELPKWMWLGLQIGATLAFSFVIWLIYQSLYVIGALCPWCMVIWTITVPIFWQVTVDNLKSNYLNFGKTFSEVVISLKWILVTATYLIAIGLIFIRWSDFWLS